MSERRKAKKELIAEHNNPINVTIMVGNIQKVIPWKEYEKDYLPSGIKKENGNN